MKKEQIIFSEISDLNVQMTYSSSLGSYVSESSKMVSEDIYKKIIKSIPENSLAYQILTNNDNYSEKQLWIITFELLKNENYCNEIMEEFYERNSREFTKKIIKKDRQTLKSQKKENQKENKKADEEKSLQEKSMITFFENKMKDILGSKVSIKNKKNNKGKIEIEYYSKDELERIIDLIQSIKE